jgi:hypothetical protein
MTALTQVSAQHLAAAVGLTLLPHIIGDYVLQNDWMAQRKTTLWRAAVLHALVYGLPFVPLLALGALDVEGWCVVVGSHAVIDRLRWGRRLAGYLGVGNPSAWTVRLCARLDPGVEFTAAPAPAALALWLPIIVDNALHMTINAACVWHALEISP